MKNTDIAKIRQKLELALTFYEDALFNASAGAVSEALALLPCETCGGTGFVQAECEACAIGVSHSASECGGGKPCPDCKS